MKETKSKYAIYLYPSQTEEINEKKQAMGLKTERTQKASYQTGEEYEQSM